MKLVNEQFFKLCPLVLTEIWISNISLFNCTWSIVFMLLRSKTGDDENERTQNINLSTQKWEVLCACEIFQWIGWTNCIYRSHKFDLSFLARKIEGKTLIIDFSSLEIKYRKRANQSISSPHHHPRTMGQLGVYDATYDYTLYQAFIQCLKSSGIGTMQMILYLYLILYPRLLSTTLHIIYFLM